MSRLSRPRPLLFLVAVALGGALGCAEWSGNKSASYSANAKETYERGARELKNENWLDAIKYFQATRQKFGFSKWATLAELGMADADFGREKYTEAIDGYRSFIKAHPTHEMTQNGYAAFRIGASFHKDIPGEWFLVPPAYEKDQGPVRDALRELRGFAQDYPESPYVKKARELVEDCIRRLGDHELYVARFYLDRGKPLATVSRLEGLLRDYPGSRLEAEVLLLLGRTFLAMEKPGEARQTFERLVRTHPEDFHAGKAQRYIEYIDRRFGAAAVVPPG